MNKLFYLLVLVIFFSSCVLKTHTQKNVLNQKSYNTAQLIKNNNSNNQTYKWTSLKGKVNIFQTENNTIKFDISIKNKKDSLIWISARALFGIELFRAQITKDSVFLIDRTQNKYFKKPINYVSNLVKYNFSFYDLQKIIANNITILEDEKYDMQINDNRYYLFNKNKTYVLNNEYQVEKINILQEENSLEVFFQDYREEDSFPAKILIKISGEKNVEASIKYLKIELNKPQKINFKIPDSYEEIL